MELWLLHDLESQLSHRKDDELAEGARQIESELLQKWEGTLPVGNEDGVVLPYDEHDWCKDNPFRDVLDSACHVLRASVMKQPSVSSLRPRKAVAR